MRITALELVADEQDFLTLNLQVPKNSDKYLVKAVYGLDPDELIAKFYGFGGNQTAYYRIGMKPREIVLRFALRPNWSINESYSDLRDNLYRAISKSRDSTIQILFMHGPTIVAETTGHIRRFEVPLFNKEPEVQITLECTDPFFRSYTRTEFFASDFDSTGYISVPDHMSTAPHGFEAQFTVTDTLADFRIMDDVLEQWSFVFGPVGGFIAGDVININTSAGQLSVTMTRSSVTTGLMDTVDTDSIWPIIFPGENQFYLPGVASLDATVDSVIFDAAFWGV